MIQTLCCCDKEKLQEWFTVKAILSYPFLKEIYKQGVQIYAQGVQRKDVFSSDKNIILQANKAWE